VAEADSHSAPVQGQVRIMGSDAPTTMVMDFGSSRR